jgi:hypothetical protein
MSTWQTEQALFQAEKDMLRENINDSYLLGDIERRMKGRSKLIKMLRRRFRNQGLVNTSSDSLNPYWLHKDSIGKLWK